MLSHFNGSLWKTLCFICFPFEFQLSDLLCSEFRLEWKWLKCLVPQCDDDLIGNELQKKCQKSRHGLSHPSPSHWLTLFMRSILGSPLYLMRLDCGRKLAKTCADMRRTFKCHIERPDLDLNPPPSGFSVTGAITAPLSAPSWQTHTTERYIW